MLLPQLATAFIRKGRSVVDSVVSLTSYVQFVQLSLCKGHHALTVFPDIKSAFGNVNISTLYNIIFEADIPTNLCNVIF